MKTKLLFGFALTIGWISNAAGSPIQQTNQMRVLDAKAIISEVKSSKAKLKVVNLWASWCAPCREELPNFAKAEKSSKDVEFFYVSGDEDKDSAEAEKFIDSTGVKGTRFRLKPIDENAFHEFSPVWSGSLPTTVVYSGSMRTDIVSERFSLENLNKLIAFRLSHPPQKALPQGFLEPKLKSSRGKK